MTIHNKTALTVLLHGTILIFNILLIETKFGIFLEFFFFFDFWQSCELNG